MKFVHITLWIKGNGTFRIHMQERDLYSTAINLQTITPNDTWQEYKIEGRTLEDREDRRQEPTEGGRHG